MPNSGGVIAFIVGPWRRRRMLRAWKRGELEFAGALGSSGGRRRAAA